MLPLDSPRWAELKHAYGDASDVPAALKELERFPARFDLGGGPWHFVWSALAHQGDVYSASFAAVPWIVHFLSGDPLEADFEYFHFPAWVEICRVEKSVPIPSDLDADYFGALNKLPSLVAAASARDRDEGFLRCGLAAIAASRGQTDLAHVILELSPDVVGEFMPWFDSR